jgi:hypothetical protein
MNSDTNACKSILIANFRITYECFKLICNISGIKVFLYDDSELVNVLQVGELIFRMAHWIGGVKTHTLRLPIRLFSVTNWGFLD